MGKTLIDELGYHNCKFRIIRAYKDKKGEKKFWGVCRKDFKPCREFEMFGNDCYELRDDEVNV